MWKWWGGRKGERWQTAFIWIAFMKVSMIGFRKGKMNIWQFLNEKILNNYIFLDSCVARMV